MKGGAKQKEKGGVKKMILKRVEVGYISLFLF